jgi:hypothetical protein
MKYALLFCTAFCLSMISYAQSANFTSNQDSLKVALLKDNMFVIYKNQQIPINTIQGLDSLMKRIPNIKQLKVDFESRNADPERSRSISTVLQQCNCEMVRRSSNYRE